MKNNKLRNNNVVVRNVSSGFLAKLKNLVIPKARGTEETAPKHALRNRKLWVLVSVIVVIVALLIFQNQRIRNLANTQTREYNQLIALVTNLRSNNQDDEARDLLLKFNEKYPNNTVQSQRYRISSELAAIYMSVGDTVNANKWLVESINYDDSSRNKFDVYFNIAENSFRANNKAEAVKYYELALEALLKERTNQAGYSYQNYIQAQLQKLKE